MNTPGQIEEVYRRRLGLLGELRQCLEQEAECLVGPDLETLWGLILRKREITADIEEANAKLRAAVQGPEAIHASSRAETPGGELSELRKKTAQLREEIKHRIVENTAFIRDTLGFLDEVIGCLTGRDREGPTYHRLQGGAEGKVPSLLWKEV